MENPEIEIIKKISSARQKLLNELSKVIIGQQTVVDELLVALFCQGHCLLIGVPGLAKTLLIKTLSKCLDLNFNRIQFTPDLMPSDITGTDIIDSNTETGKREFRFIKGPLFSNIILADEINRTPPKTQAALLQSMQEYSVTVGGITYELEKPYFVLATQNPIEQEGTYPLPEAQLDRFMFNILVDYPKEDEELEIVKSTTCALEPLINPVITADDIIEIQKLIRKVPVADNIVKYAVSIVRNSRPNENASEFVKKYIRWGAGPRSGQFLILGAKAYALINGRTCVEKQDILAVCEPVLRHRIVSTFSAEAENIQARDIIKNLIAQAEYENK